MNTRLFSSVALLVVGVVFVGGCGSASEDGGDVDDSVAHVEQQATTLLLSKLYVGLDPKVDSTCDEYTELKVTKSGSALVASLENKLSATSTCKKAVPPATRSYKLAQSDDCGSKVYKGKGANGTIAITDHRTRLCEDLRPSPVEALEVLNGFTINYYGAVREELGAAGACKVGGKSYSAGEEFLDADGCNSCKCHPNGSKGCTEKLCN